MWDLVWIRGFLELGFCWHSSFHTVLLGKLPKRAWPRRPAPSQRTSWGSAGWCPSRSSRARKPCRHWVKSGQACGGRLPPGSRPLTPGLLGLCPHLPCLTDLCGSSLLWQLGLTQLGCTALISHFGFYSCPERSTHPINTSGRTLLESGCQQAWGGAWESVFHLRLWGPFWPGREMIGYFLPAGLLGRQLTIVLPNVAFTVSSFYLYIYICIFYFLAALCSIRDPSFPRGSDSCPLHWSRGVFPTGQPGKSWELLLKDTVRGWASWDHLVLPSSFPSIASLSAQDPPYRKTGRAFTLR